MFTKNKNHMTKRITVCYFLYYLKYLHSLICFGEFTPFMRGNVCFVGGTTCHGNICGQNMPPCFLFYTAVTPGWHLDVKPTVNAL